MNDLFACHAEQFCADEKPDMTVLFDGIGIKYISLSSSFDRVKHRHGASPDHLQINYCRSGQMEWKMENGNFIYLNAGDFSLHTMNICTDSVVSFPNGRYEGLTIYIDLHTAKANPPKLLGGCDISIDMLKDKFCPNNGVSFLQGSERSENIWGGFFASANRLQWQRIKTLELLLYLLSPDLTPKNQIAAYRSEQVDIIHKIHDSLTQHMGERITIDELSRQYLINPTTLKTAFKTVYGNSIAAHIKEHRMEKAAELLRDTDASVADIAREVGYDSQSRFTSAFKSHLGVLPREYRKKP